MDHDGLVELTGKIGLVRRAQVAAPFKFIFRGTLLESFMQHLYRLVVMHARKRRHNGFQLRSVALERLQFFLPGFQHPRGDVRQKSL